MTNQQIFEQSELAKFSEAMSTAATSIRVAATEIPYIFNYLPLPSWVDFESLSLRMREIFDHPGPLNDAGFVHIEASDTWIPRTLYEGRRQEWLRMVRQAQRLPPKRIRNHEKYQWAKKETGR